MKILVNGSTMSEIINEFVFTKEEDIDMKLLDKVVGHIKRNKKMYARLVYLVVLFFNLSGVVIFANGYNSLTMEFFGYIKMACKAIMLIGWPLEIIKAVSGGTIDQLGRISMKYIALGLIIRFLPTIVSKILP
ncbi:MAG: hypothetical protein KH369_16395 [Paraclostridium bifermentans]|uniref:hypothetical protein n=1 Tax=Paraclostridium bifermentans TaxID=1490 RepID=UPI001D70C7A7|nr:hypothetical protein [Paraclostridium bifermentans]MBS6509783.1 hypothetical protein [Paraclostridium bifermentans]